MGTHTVCVSIFVLRVFSQVGCVPQVAKLSDFRGKGDPSLRAAMKHPVDQTGFSGVPDSERDMREPQMTEEMIVVLAREGHRDAFRRLYETHREGVYRTAYRYLRSVEDAEDILQETFIKAFSRIRTFDFHVSSGFYPWLISICINSAIDHLRRRERRAEKKYVSFYDLPQELAAANPSPEDAEVVRPWKGFATQCGSFRPASASFSTCAMTGTWMSRISPAAWDAARATLRPLFSGH
jgi:hypothetical protein